MTRHDLLLNARLLYRVQTSSEKHVLPFATENSGAPPLSLAIGRRYHHWHCGDLVVLASLHSVECRTRRAREVYAVVDDLELVCVRVCRKC